MGFIEKKSSLVVLVSNSYKANLNYMYILRFREQMQKHKEEYNCSTEYRYWGQEGQDFAVERLLHGLNNVMITRNE